MIYFRIGKRSQYCREADNESKKQCIFSYDVKYVTMGSDSKPKNYENNSNKGDCKCSYGNKNVKCFKRHIFLFWSYTAGFCCEFSKCLFAAGTGSITKHPCWITVDIVFFTNICSYFDSKFFRIFTREQVSVCPNF